MIQALSALTDSSKSDRLAASAARFLEKYGTPALLGREWGEIFEGVRPEDRFDNLLACCGFDRDPAGFFKTLGKALSAGPAGHDGIRVKGICLPPLFIYHLLEAAAPGQALFSIKNLDQLERRTGMTPEPGLQKVLETYPVRLSSHVIRQSLASRAVAVQYLPFSDELDPLGHELTFDGHFKQGLMEQMYRNRAIFLLDMRCPVYCRFCFRKHKSLRKEAPPGAGDVQEALARVRENPEIKEILITGGEPLLNPGNLETALDGLLETAHVRFIRIATRSLAYYPQLFLQHDKRVIRYLKNMHGRCRDNGKQLEVGVHMVHPDEVSVQTLEIISDLTASGIPVYVQTPFLKGLNDQGPVLKKLFDLLRLAGAQIYYIFTPCHPIHGTRKYWSPIEQSLSAYAWLRENASDRAMPKLCTATPLGKMEWHSSGWAVDKDRSEKDHIWVRTPYTRDYFAPMTKTGELPVATRENKGGTLDVKCLINMGRDSLFLGDEGPAAASEPESGAGCETGQPLSESRLDEIQSSFYDSSPLMATDADTGVPGLIRVHKTRVEMNVGPGERADQSALDYLRKTPEITDVVLRVADSGNLAGELQAIEKRAVALRSLDRPWLFIRIQWPAMQKMPDAFTPEIISRLRALSRPDISRPVRLECETWWLAAEQITPVHDRLVGMLTRAGIPVYANTALINGLNTRPETAQALAHRIRAAGMHFHQVYTGGLEIQKEYNGGNSVTAGKVVALASRIRMNCTGREIPLYVEWTSNGERDFGTQASG